MLPKSSVAPKVGRAVPSAPGQVAETGAFRTSAGSRGALGTARPTSDRLGQHALTSFTDYSLCTWPTNRFNRVRTPGGTEVKWI